MWTENDCDASKKRKTFKNCEHGKLEEVGGKGRELGGSRVGVEGRPRPIRWPTGSTALADRADGLGRPLGRPRATGRTASGDRADSIG